MQFNHYGWDAALLAADLVNLDAPAPPDALRDLLARHGITRPDLTGEQAALLWEWSRRLAPCFGARDLAARCAEINALLAEASGSPYIATHDGFTPHLHYSAPGADRVAHVRAVTAVSLAYVVCAGGADRLGRCARQGCRRAFVDTSRNGRRSYCSVRCANNDAVARHRAVRRAAANPPTTR
jgi:predicted RNA-binding Zn ribbon-like protein